MRPPHWKVMTWSLGLFGAVTFILCVVYGFVVHPAFHMTQLLAIALLGFRRPSVRSFVMGLAENFLYGAHTGLVFTPLYHYSLRQFGN